MNHSIVTGLLFTVLPWSALADWQDNTLWQKVRAADILFLDQHGWDNVSRSCATLIANDGRRLSDEKHIVATGRAIYGYTYGGGKADFLTKASALTDYVLMNMVEWGDPRPYFFSLVDGSGKRVFKPNETTDDPRDTTRMQPKELRIYEQFYGLTGLLATFHAKTDSNLRDQIETLYEAWFERFHDPVEGGFFDSYDMDNNRPVREKSFASTIYPLTAFYFSYLETIQSAEKKREVEGQLVQLAKHAIDHFYAPATGRVREKWDGDAVQNGRPFYMPGHALQMAWVLLRMVQKRYVIAPESTQFTAVAKHIIETAVREGGDLQRGGIYNAIHTDLQGGFVWGKSKHWWQQEYPILAITLGERMGVITDPHLLQYRDRTIDFYLRAFLDPKGGVFAEVNEDGSQVLSGEKGMSGKWAYHHTELVQFMLYYAKPISDEVANCPYPGEAISGGSMADCTPEARRQRAWQGREYGITLPPRTALWASPEQAGAQLAARNRRTVEQFFANYSLIAEWPKFAEAQSKLLSPDLSTSTDAALGNQTYEGADGYFASLGDWSQLFATGKDFRVELVEVSAKRVVARLHGTLTRKDATGVTSEIPDSGHEWTEAFEFDRDGRIEKLSVRMNLK